MNSYNYYEISMGDKHQFKVEITEEKMKQFCAISNDTNPLHTDLDYAKSKGFNNKVAYGMLTASFLSTLAGMYIPGKFSLIHSVEIKFMKPVILGDILTIDSTVSEKSDTYKLLTLKVLILNADGVKVAKATMNVGVMDE